MNLLDIVYIIHYSNQTFINKEINHGKTINPKLVLDHHHHFLHPGILGYPVRYPRLHLHGRSMYHALKGEGKIHCSKYCPRGSFLGKFLQRLSLQNQLPAYMRTRMAKNILLGVMMTVFSISMIHTGFVFEKMAFALFRFMGMSFVIGILMGVFFKPRSWCVVCPMGHGAGLISESRKKGFRLDGLKVFE